jgi:hypothetical protein
MFRPRFEQVTSLIQAISVTVSTNLVTINFFNNHRIGAGIAKSATGYWLDNQGSIPGKGKIFVSVSERPDRVWGPPSLLSNGYRGLFPRG